VADSWALFFLEEKDGGSAKALALEKEMASMKKRMPCLPGFLWSRVLKLEVAGQQTTM